MSIEQQIAALLDEALPYRALHDDDPGKAPLTAIIDEINRLRELESTARYLGHELEFQQLTEEVNPKRGPGRPKKVQ